MVPIDRRAGVCLFLLAVASAPAAAKQPKQPAPRIPREILQPAPAPPGPPPPAPPPAESDGWPHTIESGYTVNCASEPGPGEVIVYRDRGFKGRCALLRPGFYPRHDNFLVGQDAISSLKVGSAVRLRAFEDTAYGGTFEIFAPGTRSAGIGELHDEISSLRVEPADRSANCDDLREGEVGLYHHPDFRGDCVVLPGKGSFVNADALGIRNDSVSSIRNNSRRTLYGYDHTEFDFLMLQLPPHSSDRKLVGDSGWLTVGFDDQMSSLQMVDP